MKIWFTLLHYVSFKDERHDWLPVFKHKID